MSEGIVKFTVDQSGFNKFVQDRAALAGKTIDEALHDEFRLLCAELIKNTPPYSGKALKGMLGVQGKQLRDPDVENMSALAIGKRRVERDIRKVIFGVRGAAMPAAPKAQKFSSQNIRPQTVDWAVQQKCEGKTAWRIFARKDGVVYGVDTQNFKANATLSDLSQTHSEHRTGRGRVTTAGSKDRVIGRWRWLNILVTKEALVRKYIALKQGMVGQARGGWAAGFMAHGGRMSARGWVGKHSGAGEYKDSSTPNHPKFSQTNNSAWASNGDPEGVINRSLVGRARALEADIRRRLTEVWGNKSHSNETLKKAA